MESGLFLEVSVSLADLAKVIYFFRGIADADAIGKLMFQITTVL